MVNKLLFVSIGTMFLMTKMDIDSDKGVSLLRIGYLASTIYCGIGYMWMYTVISSKNDRTKFLKTPASEGKEAVYEEKMKYDMQKLTEMFQQFATSFVFMAFIHFTMKGNRPLLFQCCLNPFNLIECQLFKIHLLGLDDQIEDLQRPWPAPNLFGAPSAPPQRKWGESPPQVADGAAAAAQVEVGLANSSTGGPNPPAEPASAEEKKTS
eukprot:CAMPEP_0196738136 /NCGR_PEP_ID=MMETSP1091-20130531/15653_1 /TAXON_ID=302021 /ORGANISM="Rhodomonas sp., Strain CCMP768" /LENGTH=208 /DNA_ID=CAMNT_0042082091 /DNA_START=51 /DNA_END=677 /DNA_ORIENTATION=+